MVLEYSVSGVSAALLLITCGAGILILRGSHDKQEPRSLSSTIPIVGHLIGIIVRQADYLTSLCSRTQWPIFTLNILGGKAYVIRSGELVQSVYRNPKTLSFGPIFMSSSIRIFGMTKRQVDILRAPRQGIEDEFPVSVETQMGMHSILQNPAVLKDMEARGLTRFSGFLGERDEEEERKPLQLYRWVAMNLSLATAAAVYGDENPFSKVSSRMDELNHLAANIPLLFLNILPSWTAPRAYKARQNLHDMFDEYYGANKHLQASELVKGRYKTMVGAGFNGNDCAQFDGGLLVGATMNSSPATFWFLCYIYSSSSLLSQLRSEISTITIFDEEKREAKLDVSSLDEKCPLLISGWKEILRVCCATLSSRIVMKSTELKGGYNLKEGGFIQMLIGSIHTDSTVWGEDADVFVPERFLKSTMEAASKEEKKRRRVGFHPFGGGTVLCPGRYFATTSILSVVATIVAGYDITTSDGMAISVPPFKKQTLGEQFKHPKHDIEVLMTRRKGWEGIKFVHNFDSKGDGKEEWLDF